jgi:hypothetical protein
VGGIRQSILTVSSPSLRDALAQAAIGSTYPTSSGRSRIPLTTAPGVEEMPVTAWGVEKTAVAAPARAPPAVAEPAARQQQP